MEEVKFTHLAKIYGVKCYFNDQNNEVKGVNFINDVLIDIFIWIDFNFFDSDGFHIEIIKEL